MGRAYRTYVLRWHLSPSFTGVSSENSKDSGLHRQPLTEKLLTEHLLCYLSGTVLGCRGGGGGGREMEGIGESQTGKVHLHDHSFTVATRASKLIPHKCMSDLNPESRHEALGAPGQVWPS